MGFNGFNHQKWIFNGTLMWIPFGKLTVCELEHPHVINR